MAAGVHQGSALEQSGWQRLVLFVAGFLSAVGIWLVAGDGAWGPPEIESKSVPILEARVDADARRLELVVGSCQGAPRARAVYENDALQVEVMAFVTRLETNDCLDSVTVSISHLSLDLPPTEIIDRHSDSSVTVEPVGS